MNENCMIWELTYVWERSVGEDGLGDNTREGKHSKTAVGDLLELHVVNVFIRLSLEHTTIPSEVSRGTSRSLKHLHNSNTINDLSQAEPKKQLGHTSLLNGSIVSGSGGDTFKSGSNRKNTHSHVNGDISKPCHHGNTAVLELSFTEEVDRSEVRKSERVEADISNVSLAVWWGFKEGKSL